MDFIKQANVVVRKGDVIDATSQGIDIYRSPDVTVTKQLIEGSVMKAIENLGLFNSQNYHKRFIRLDFSR